MVGWGEKGGGEEEEGGHLLHSQLFPLRSPISLYLQPLLTFSSHFFLAIKRGIPPTKVTNNFFRHAAGPIITQTFPVWSITIRRWGFPFRRPCSFIPSEGSLALAPSFNHFSPSSKVHFPGPRMRSRIESGEGERRRREGGPSLFSSPPRFIPAGVDDPSPPCTPSFRHPNLFFAWNHVLSSLQRFCTMRRVLWIDKSEFIIYCFCRPLEDTNIILKISLSAFFFSNI